MEYKIGQKIYLDTLTSEEQKEVMENAYRVILRDVKDNNILAIIDDVKNKKESKLLVPNNDRYNIVVDTIFKGLKVQVFCNNTTMDFCTNV